MNRGSTDNTPARVLNLEDGSVDKAVRSCQNVVNAKTKLD